MIEPSKSLLNILLVDDEPSAVHLLSHHLKDLKIDHQMTVFRTGEEAVEYLEGRIAREGIERKPLPDLIFLDLRLPGENGLEALAQIKTNPNLRNIPVIVSTVSKEQEDLIESYKRGGTFFLQKSNDEKMLGVVLQQLKAFNRLKK